MRVYKINLVISVLILLLSITVSSFIVFAQEDHPDIDFPVAELGGCEGEEECRSYCDDPNNISACVDFAIENGLMDEEEASIARKFADTLQTGGGPGGCTDHKSCNQYCEDIVHIDECIAFADEHGHSDDELEEARKIKGYLDGGGEMPGGCTNKDSCQNYCSDFEHMDECLAFADGVGIDIGDHEDENIGKEQLRVIAELMKNGETPGGCQSKGECENYCRGEDNFEECIAFGERVGFIPPEEAELIRKTGGVGPGGCQSKDGCDAYCNEPENREQCFQFATDHGLLSDEDRRDIEKGLGRLKEVLVDAPSEVVGCIENEVGGDIIENIEKGTLVLGRSSEGQIEECFTRMREIMFVNDIDSFLEEIPENIKACALERLGPQIERAKQGEKAGIEDDFHRVIDDCFRSIGLEELEGRIQEGDISPEEIEHMRQELETSNNRTDGDPNKFYEDERGPQDYENIGSEIPPESIDCVRERLGHDFEEKIQSGALAQNRLAPTIEECIRSSIIESRSGDIPEEFIPDYDYDSIKPEQYLEGGYDGSFTSPPDYIEVEIEIHDTPPGGQEASVLEAFRGFFILPLLK